MTPACLLLMGLALTQSGVATGNEERVVGDPALRAIVEARARAIYDEGSRPEASRSFLLTTGNVLAVTDGLGTEVSATSGAAGSRMVATVWSTEGKYSVEFFRSPEHALLLVYETFEYFNEKAPPDAWRNFRGLAAWERRTYFDEREQVGCTVSRGRQVPAPGAGADGLRDRADRLAKAIGQR